MKASIRRSPRRGKKPTRRRRHGRTVVIRAVTPRTKRSRQNLLEVRCVVIGTHPDAEAVCVRERAFGKSITILVPTREQDGAAVARLGLEPGNELWLSLRRART